MVEGTFERKKFYDNLEKYALSAYAASLYMDDGGKPIKPTEEGKAAARLIGKSKDLGDFVDDWAEGMDVRQVLGADTQQYQEYLLELTVSEALKHIAETTGFSGDFAPIITQFGGRTLRDLNEDARKYNEAVEKYMKAKTPQEATEALQSKQRYERSAVAFSKVMQYDRAKLTSYSAGNIAREIIANDQRRLKKAEETQN